MRALSRVDFPAPDAPMMAKTSPGLQYPLAMVKKSKYIQTEDLPNKSVMAMQIIHETLRKGGGGFDDVSLFLLFETLFLRL